ncbi:MAG: hypothetical protein J5917_02935 [Bacteroidales bacterium]|nr:hypothetical protein [Bacteroidales bacterium]
MKKIMLRAVLLLALTSCGTSGVAVKSTKPEVAYLSFSAGETKDIIVIVDGKEYRKETIRLNSASGSTNIQQMAGSFISLDPGSHKVVVKDKSGKELCTHEIKVAAREHKMIAL